MENLPTPPKEAILYEDAKLYICLASFPITKGHTVIVWKTKAEDIHLLSREDYEYLMDAVDVARDVLLEKLQVQKVYLMYMDEARQVHWHLIPRYEEQGFNLLLHTPVETTDFSLASVLEGDLQIKMGQFIQ